MQITGKHREDLQRRRTQMKFIGVTRDKHDRQLQAAIVVSDRMMPPNSPHRSIGAAQAAALPVGRTTCIG
jgi:hypothetical protein